MFLLRGITDRKIQKLIVAMLNKQRLSQQWSRCVPLFSWDPALASAAQAWADQCALVEYIGTTTHGETFFPPYSEKSLKASVLIPGSFPFDLSPVSSGPLAHYK